MRRKSNAVGDFVDWLVPDQFESGLGGLHDDLAVLLNRFGDGVRPALYEFLCDETGKSRSAAKRALNHSVEAGVALVVPILVKDFKLDAVAAIGVATLVIKALATRGQGKLCEELSASVRVKPKKPKRPLKRPPRKPPKKQASRPSRPVKKRR